MSSSLLTSRWRSELRPEHRRLAEIVEMIHTASLVHDDVLDETALRRGVCPVPLSLGNSLWRSRAPPQPNRPAWRRSLEQPNLAGQAGGGARSRAPSRPAATRLRDVRLSRLPRAGKSTVHTVFGVKVAVLVGDYLFAQSSSFLANLDNLEVIKLISQVIADFANGEISQLQALFDVDITLEDYLEKSFFKTASLISASCRGEAVFSGADEGLKQDMGDYGRHLGLAFQVVDDILDFTQSTEQLGKPQGQDLASGNLTAPAILALASPQGGPRLRQLIESEFMEPGALEEALALVRSTGGLAGAMALARAEGDAALLALHRLPPGEARRSLEAMVAYVLERRL